MDIPFRGNPVLKQGLDLLDYDPFRRLSDGTRYQQPALFLCSLAAWANCEDSDPVCAAGHSLGEYAALTASGVFDLESGLRLVDARAVGMARACKVRPGGMVAVLGGDREGVAALATELGLSVANDNAPGQVVLAGSRQAIGAAEERAQSVGARVIMLDVSGAFHSPLMKSAAGDLERALATVEVRPGRFPVYSNGTAMPFGDVRKELCSNLLRPVRWRETILAMHGTGVREFVEVGPGRVLTALVPRIVPGGGRHVRRYA